MSHCQSFFFHVPIYGMANASMPLFISPLRLLRLCVRPFDLARHIMNTILFANVTNIWLLAGWTMIHFLWLGTLVAAAGFLVRLLLHRIAPNVRYVAALACLAILAVLPIGIATWLATHTYLPITKPHLAVTADLSAEVNTPIVELHQHPIRANEPPTQSKSQPVQRAPRSIPRQPRPAPAPRNSLQPPAPAPATPPSVARRARNPRPLPPLALAHRHADHLPHHCHWPRRHPPAPPRQPPDNRRTDRRIARLNSPPRFASASA